MLKEIGMERLKLSHVVFSWEYGAFLAHWDEVGGVYGIPSASATGLG